MSDLPEPRVDVRHRLSGNFDALRRTRAERRAPAGTRKRGAVITIVRNEPVFFPIWLRYYSRFFGPDDIYVLDHATTDGSTAGGGFVRIPVTHETVDHTWMVRTIERHQHELMERYDAVVVTDVDEIVAPHPSLGTLADYLDRLEEPYVNCLGYEIVHMADREPPFDSSRGVLEQRGHWFANDIYDKPAVTTVPMEWVPGFHRSSDYEMRPDPDLYLIHLHRMDYEICLERHRFRAGRAWNERDVELGWAGHNRITDDASFRRWFYEDSSTYWSQPQIERIPEDWRAVV